MALTRSVDLCFIFACESAGLSVKRIYRVCSMCVLIQNLLIHTSFKLFVLKLLVNLFSVVDLCSAKRYCRRDLSLTGINENVSKQCFDVLYYVPSTTGCVST